MTIDIVRNAGSNSFNCFLYDIYITIKITRNFGVAVGEGILIIIDVSFAGGADVKLVDVRMKVACPDMLLKRPRKQKPQCWVYRVCSADIVMLKAG